MLTRALWAVVYAIVTLIVIIIIAAILMSIQVTAEFGALLQKFAPLIALLVFFLSFLRDTPWHQR